MVDSGICTLGDVILLPMRQLSTTDQKTRMGPWNAICFFCWWTVQYGLLICVHLNSSKLLLKLSLTYPSVDILDFSDIYKWILHNWHFENKNDNQSQWEIDLDIKIIITNFFPIEWCHLLLMIHTCRDQYRCTDICSNRWLGCFNRFLIWTFEE